MYVANAEYPKYFQRLGSGTQILFARLVVSFCVSSGWLNIPAAILTIKFHLKIINQLSTENQEASN